MQDGIELHAPEGIETRLLHRDVVALMRRAGFKRLYFPLAPYAEGLKRFYSEVKMSDHLRTLCVQMLAKGLPDIAVSHPADWGIPVPFPGFVEKNGWKICAMRSSGIPSPVSRTWT